MSLALAEQIRDMNYTEPAQRSPEQAREEIRRLRSQRQQIETILELAARKDEAIEKLRLDNARLAVALNESEARRAQLERDLDDLRGELHVSYERMNETRVQLLDTQATVAYRDQDIELRDQRIAGLESVEEELLNTQEAMAMVEQAHADALAEVRGEHEEAISMAKNAHERDLSMTQDEHAKELARFRKQLAIVTEEKQALQSKIEAKRAEQKRFRGTMSQLQSQLGVLDELRDANDALLSRSQAAEFEVESLRLQLSEAERRLVEGQEALTSQLVEARASLEETGNRNQGLREENERLLRSLTTTASQLEEGLEVFNVRNNKLKSENQELQSKNRELTAMAESLTEALDRERKDRRKQAKARLSLLSDLDFAGAYVDDE